MSNTACVYRIAFPNGKSYIGATRKTALQRLKAHLYCARRVERNLPNKKTQPVHFAIVKYGAENIRIETLFVGPISQCFAHEIQAIAEYGTRYPNGYNLTSGGEGVRGISEISRAKISAANKGNTYSKGNVPSAITRKKISASNMGHAVSKETREKIGAVHRGRKHTKEAKDRMSKSMQGRTLSEESKEKISAAKKGKPFSAEHIEKLAAAKRGKAVSQESNAKRSAALRGRPLSDEHKAKIGAAHRARLMVGIKEAGVLA